MLRHAMGLVGLGITVALAASLGLGRFIRSMLFGVSETDPWTFTAVPLILAAVGLVAAYLPARRAGKVNPLEALREE